MSPAVLADLNCTLVQVTTSESAGRVQKFGNGFAVTSQHILVNDHTLSADSNLVGVLLQGPLSRPVVGRVIHRDFHTDLAVVQLDSTKLSPCPISPTPQELLQGEVAIEGGQKGDRQNSTVQAEIANPVSTKSTVPGIAQAVELLLDGGLNFSPGRSGSVTVQGEKIVGMLTQKTAEGALLAVPSHVLAQKLKEIQSGHFVERRYSIDYSTGTISFGGLKVPSPNSSGGTPHEIGGTPHESGGNPHELGNSFLSLDDRDLGYAMTQVQDLPRLRNLEPQLAAVLEQTKSVTVYISKIDNFSVRNELQLLRALGACQPCQITEYWLPIENQADVRTIQQQEVRVIALATQLVQLLDQSKLPATTVNLSIEAIRTFHGAMSAKIQHTRVGLRDPNDSLAVRKAWDQVEEILSHVFVNDRLLDTVDQLRQELPSLY